MTPPVPTLTKSDLWALAHGERAALLADLETLTADQWAAPSLCDGWTVEQVVAHLTAAASIGRARWVASVLGARFDFDLHNLRRLTERLGSTPAETLDQFRQVVTSSTSTFGPVAAWLGEVVVHAADIRRSLGIEHTTAVAAITPVAEHFARTDFTVNSRTLINGLRLEATDGPFRTGDGPTVTGTTQALTMIMAGRSAYHDDLEGPGVQTLRDRCLRS